MPGMLALTVEQGRQIKKALFELKVDGTRMTFDNGELVSDRLINRNDRYPHIVAEVRKMNCTVRGEVALPGGNILQLNRAVNWHKAKYFVFDLFAVNGKSVEHLSVFERREMLERIVAKGNFKHITVPKKFKTFDEGWNYVKKNEAEGIVIKEPNAIWKVKLLKELKVPIVKHVEGKAKGAFLINYNGVVSKVSGTSLSFIEQYNALVRAGKKVLAEIECPFITDDGAPYQPRLRRIGTAADLKYT